jgi:hypothetical protein
MTQLGKVFTGILMVLSVIFFLAAVMANATHVDYREALNDPTTGLKAVAAREQAKVAELTTLVEQQKEAVVIELSARRAALTSLQTQLEQINFEVQQKEQDLAARQVELTQLAATEQTTQQEVIERSAENERMLAQLTQARQARDAQFAKLVQAYDQYLRLQGEHKTLQLQVEELNTSPSNTQ